MEVSQRAARVGVAEWACALCQTELTASPQSSSKPVACRLYPARPRGASAGPVRHGAVRIGEARRGPARVLEAATPTAAATAGPGGVHGYGTVSVLSMGAGGFGGGALR